MADAEGPGKHKPRECSTRNSFTALCGLQGFDAPGKGPYSLDLIEGGVYRRTPIVAAQEPDWALKIELSSQYMDMHTTPFKIVEGIVQEGEHSVKRLVNAGSMLMAYNATTVKNPPEITGNVYFYSVGAKIRSDLKATPVFHKDLEILKKPPAGSTIYLELVLGMDIPTDWVEVLPGVGLKWSTPQLIGLIITNPGGKLSVSATSPDVQIQATKASLYFIHCGPYHQFVRLLFSIFPVSDVQLERLIRDIDHRESELKKLVL